MVLARKSSIWMEVLLRIATAAALSFFVWKAFQEYRTCHARHLILLVIAEVIAVFLVLIARAATSRDMRVSAVALTVGATFYFLVVDLSPGRVLIPPRLGQMLQVFGIALQILAKLWLGRRFGLLPANRGIISEGPYLLVRHPMYLGYLLNHIGFLLCCFSLHNLCVYTVLYAIQVGRIFLEEKHLAADPEYRSYMQKVRWRLVPFLF
jgi:protein-S-isoprenylcysteine O-methyltransferase Ste14